MQNESEPMSFSGTRALLDRIRRTPQIGFHPLPAYAARYLPFAMSAGFEVTPGGRLWTCWIGEEVGPCHSSMVPTTRKMRWRKRFPADSQLALLGEKNINRYV